MIPGIGAIAPQGIGTSGPSFPAPQAGSAAGAGAGTLSFSDLLSQVAGETVGKLTHAEQVSVRALQGDVDTREVVDAVMSAEQSLQAAIAIRDKIVSAYMEISRMAI